MGSSRLSNNVEDDAISEINVVPLVDIILVVLIIFMISAPMIMKPALPVELPKANSGESIKDKSATITISQDGQLFLDETRLDLAQLEVRIKERLTGNPELMVMISADQKSQHGDVVRVMDRVKILGVKKFGISIEKQP